MSTNGILSLIRLLLTVLGFSDVLDRKLFLTAKATPDSLLTEGFSTLVKGVTRLLFNAATFSESDLTRSRNVDVALLGFLGY